ncbi:MAG: chromosome partitioning protein ParB [Leptospiraceae bacterium]|nr:MAG: chromosome partitioning protein ParB [Leptospiraceae bacterium]
MVRIKPFRAYIPNSQFVEEIICPPYDVIDTEEARQIAKQKGEKSFIHIIRSEVDFPEDFNPYSEEIYLKAKENLETFIKNKYFIQEKEDVFFIYQLEWQGHKQSGIVGLTHIDDYLNNKIKKHEFTRPEKEEDRFRHIDITGFNCEPVFFAFKSENALELENFINSIVSNANLLLYDVIDENSIRHRIFEIIENNHIQYIIKSFSELPAIYIADGHHRTASTVRAGLKRKENDPDYNPDKPYNYFLSVTFPSKQLRILPYNRVVKDLNGLTKEEFLERLQEKFHIQKGKQSLKEHEFNLYLEKEWFHLKLNDKFYRKGEVENLDVSYLQDYILDPILNIKDPRTSDRIHFIGGIKGEDELQRLVDSGKWKIAFSLYPTPIEALFKVADAGKVMPPKSTWFEPKLKSGFFLYNIDGK